MASPTARRRAGVLRYVGAALFAAAAYVALSAIAFYPLWLAWLLTAAVAGLALSSPAAASPVFVIAVALPVASADAVAGAFVLVAGLTTAWLLRDDGGVGFLLVALTVIAVPLHVEWALAPLAGYLLGPRRGAGAALAACLAIETVGLLMGAATLGVTVTGGSTTLMAISPPEGGVLGFGWLTSSVAAADPARLLGAVNGVQHVVLLVAQPLLWAAAAVIASAFRKPGAGLRALAGVALGVAFLAVGVTVLSRAVAGPIPFQDYLIAAVASLAVSLAVTAASEWLFPVVTARAPAARRGIRTEDAEVDELLNLIASAEDQLANRHRTEAVVMITDMKSFSALTEELGSLEVAKLVQRHRDVLLPVVERYHGKGKSTGGDGLLAAFKEPRAAVDAAIEMQRALAGLSGSGQIDRELLIRVGIAAGEVVLDSGGRPFLGAGLNLAARVMNLADGGRIMITAQVAEASRLPDPLLHAHGPFELKNIAEPVEVVEVLWREGETPQEF